MKGGALNARRCVVAVLLAAIVIAASVPSAGAAEKTINVCGDATASINDWSGPPPDLFSNGWIHWRMDAFCPTMTLYSIPATRNFWYATWQFPANGPGRVKFTNVSFDIRGSDGTDGGAGNRVQGVKVCSSSDVCTPLIQPPGSDESQPLHHDLSVADGSLPADADRFQIVGSCTVTVGPVLPDSCSVGRELQVSNINLTFEDSTPPTVELAEPDPLDESLQLVVDGWNSGARSIWAQALDMESGVTQFEFKLNDARYLEWTGCQEPYVQMLVRLCTESALQRHTITGSHLDLRHGPNQLHIRAYDAAGNISSPRTVDFKYDKLRPIVSELRAVGANGIWQTSRNVNLAWTNTPDTTYEPGISPVVRARAVVYERLTPRATVDSGSTNIPGINTLGGITLPNQGLFRLRFNVWDEGGNTSDYYSVEVGVDDSVPGAPVLDALPLLGSNDLANGASVHWTAPPAVRSGTCGYAMSVNDESSADPGSLKQISADATSAPLPAGLSDGANFVHLRAISCAGVPGEIAHREFQVDAAAPLISLTDPPADGWYTNEKLLLASVPAEPGVQMSVTVDGTSDDWADGFERAVPLDEGEHDVVVRVRDAHGNESARAVHAKFDGYGPRSAFAAFDTAHPTLVRAAIHDSHAGVASAYLQYRALGETQWQGFGASLHLGDARKSVEIAESLPDTELADGFYELRVIAFDAAGHRAASYSRADGSPAMLALPLRSPATVRIGFPTPLKRKTCKTRKRGKCLKARNSSPGSILAQKLLGYGTTAPMHGVLLDPAGNPVGGTVVKIFESVSGAPRKLVGRQTTGPDGAFAFTPLAGPSRKVTVRFEGSDTVAPAEGEAKLLVRGKVRFRISRRADSRSPVDIFGRVSTLGANFPAGGRIKIQYLAGGEFRPFPVDVVVAVDGSFTARLKFPATRRAVRYRLRAVVPSPQSGWPYEESVSPVRKLVVG